VQEIKVQTGKCKNPTKVDLPIMTGLEVIKVVDSYGVVLEAVPSPSDLGVAKAYKVWKAYDCISAAWSANPGDDASDTQTASQALGAAAEGIFLHFFMLLHQRM
jgi:hypothetical protein